MESDDDDVTQQLHNRRFRWSRWVFAVGLVALCFAYCGGFIRLPLMDPRGTLSEYVFRDLQVNLPAEMTVVRGSWHYTRDPAGFFELRGSQDVTASFVNAIEAAAAKHGWTARVDPLRPEADQQLGAKPAWFRPSTLTDGQTLWVSPRDGSTGYVIHYSLTDGRLYVCWYAT